MNQLKQTDLASTNSTPTFGNLIKTRLQKKLAGLPSGVLLIEDSGTTKKFGQIVGFDDITGEIIIHDKTAYADIAFGGSVGAAEAYMQGKWSSPNLVNLVRLMALNIDFLNGIDDGNFIVKRLADKAYHWLNRNSEKQAKRNIAAHYDLSNDFFSLFLDPTMMYSAAVFADAETELDAAAVYKLNLVCEKLELKPQDHLLEIGTGWGGLAIHAAKHFGCRVTTTTISKEQYQLACKKVADAGLDKQITVMFEDYRKLQGSFDKLVSIEMIEAVGQENYRDYFAGCSSLLKPDGLMLLQAITIPAQRYQYALNSVDFIQRYIFPGGSLPSHEIIMSSLRKHTDMQMVAMLEIGEDYAKTLRIWQQRFVAQLDQVRKLGFDEYFIRMWNYYLCYCQGAFEERVIGTTQMLFAKPGWRAQPIAR